LKKVSFSLFISLLLSQKERDNHSKGKERDNHSKGVVGGAG
jgi:hypothetical protein